MSRKRKGELPSGNIRRQVYVGSELVYDNNGKPILDLKTGKQKKRRIYKSITGNSTNEVESIKASYIVSGKNKPIQLVLSDAMDCYIREYKSVLSATTIQGYEKIKRNYFTCLMGSRIDKITNEDIQAAINVEVNRPSLRNPSGHLSAKTIANAYGFLITVLNHYYPNATYSIKLPPKQNKIKELPRPEVIFSMVKDTEIELPVLLAMWLSFTLSEIRGLKKSTSISNGYITINRVVVDVNCEAIEKSTAKTYTRIRKHRIPAYINTLINNIETDELVILSGHAIYMRFKRLLAKNEISHMSFHDLRHMNASIMELLDVPGKYAMERGGWKTDKVMKSVYTHTFSKEREEVDNRIDNFFNTSVIINDESDERYKSFLILFGLVDSVDSKEKYDTFSAKMQHEIQHEIKKTPNYSVF